jgi:VWFA-related protein
MARFRHPKEKKMFFLIGRMRECSDRVRNGSSNEWTVFVNIETAAHRKQNRRSTANWLAAALVLACLCAGVPTILGQSSPDQPPQTQQTQPAQDIPDAPTVQPSTEKPEPPPIPRPEEKKPVERDPWTNQPINKLAPTQPDAANNDGTSAPPPPMPPVKTLPPGTSAKPSAQDELTLKITPTFVQVPVTVKNKDGRMVDGLLSTDFTVKENGIPQKLSFFSADPFALAVAIVIDTGMSDGDLQKVNQSFSALTGAFAAYDEVSLYTYSSTVSQVSDFAGANQRLTAVLNRIKTVRGNSPPFLGGPLADGPIINGVPVGGPPTEPVYTAPKEDHVLNDAILRAALDLRKRERTRRKIIFVISDGREYGSKASYGDVKKVLLSNEIQVQAVLVGSAALPVYDKLDRLHLPRQGYTDILPKYASATGGAEYRELSRSAIEDAYARAMIEARNQYTLGYTPARPKTPTAVAYRSIEVVVHRPGLKVFAKDGYYPVVTAR